MNKFHKLTIAQGGSAELTLDVGVNQLAICNNNGTEGGAVLPISNNSKGFYFVEENKEIVKENIDVTDTTSYYSSYILICDCDIDTADHTGGTSSMGAWDITKLSAGNKYLILANPTHNSETIYGNNLRCSWELFDNITDAINKFNSGNQLHTQTGFAYYTGGYCVEWNKTLPYYASDNFNFAGDLNYSQNILPALRPRGE